MFLATAVLSGLLAATLALAAVRKLSHSPDVVASYARVGVPEERLDLLAAILLAGAAGLVAGLAWAPVGVAAASCLVAYFVLAIRAHVEHDDRGELAVPVILLVAAGATVALRLATM